MKKNRPADASPFSLRSNYNQQLTTLLVQLKPTTMLKLIKIISTDHSVHILRTLSSVPEGNNIQDYQVWQYLIHRRTC